jgi:hypothetical protein
MIEILEEFKEELSSSLPLRNSFHLCEAPGGFIEATNNSALIDQDHWKWTSVSLKDDIQFKLPFMLKKKGEIVLGPEGNGDITLPENLSYFCKKYENSFELATADGGFEGNLEQRNQQESESAKLLWHEIMISLYVLKNDGFCVVKLFDTFEPVTLRMLFIFSQFFKKSFIVKPVSSRVCNSERYLIGCSFLRSPEGNNGKIGIKIPTWEQIISEDNEINDLIPNIFSHNLNYINWVLADIQIQYLKEAFALIDVLKKQNIKKRNIAKLFSDFTNNQKALSFAKLFHDNYLNKK